ncbi:MAG: DUF4188 domain-containing protein [Chloroflexi bacterium]|nr:DUF4188 domain-containing protein [Chloroflexota bacterium]
MSSVLPGRFTAQADEPFVVFLIGMRINRLRALHKWLPVFMSMPPMLIDLQKHPEKGMLGSRLYWSGRVIQLVQYWRTFEQLEKFARSADDPHLGPWQKFNKAVGKSGIVGIFHETYLVEPGKFEAVYANMPQFGLAAATEHVPAVGRRETARRRLGGQNEPAVAVL